MKEAVDQGLRGGTPTSHRGDVQSLGDRLREEEVEVLGGRAQLREQDRLARLLLICLIQDAEHLFRVWSDPQGSELDFLVHESEDQLFKDATLRVSFWVPVISRSKVVILSAMGRSVPDEYSVASLTLPLLF